MYTPSLGDKISPARSDSISSSHSDERSIFHASPRPTEGGAAFNAFRKRWQSVQLPIVPLEMLASQWKMADEAQAVNVPDYLLSPPIAFYPTRRMISSISMARLTAPCEWMTMADFYPEVPFGDSGLFHYPAEKVSLPLASQWSQNDESLSSFSGSMSSGDCSPTIRLPLSRSEDSRLSSNENANSYLPDYFPYHAYQRGIVSLPIQLAPYESRDPLPNADPAENLAFLQLDRLRRLAAARAHLQNPEPQLVKPAPTSKAAVNASLPNQARGLPAQLKPDKRLQTNSRLISGDLILQPLPNRINGDNKPVNKSAYRKLIRTYRCKQCDYLAKSKDDYWYHSRVHIKVHKMLSCPKCLFVTEHKHHLEYHLRNHLGSKPFKCSKCTYSCVNNSMLKSHMKSHTSHCEYRCADCNYATKYCHSLKLHLKKRGHKAANEEALNGFRKWSVASSGCDCVVPEAKG